MNYRCDMNMKEMSQITLPTMGAQHKLSENNISSAQEQLIRKAEKYKDGWIWQWWTETKRRTTIHFWDNTQYSSETIRNTLLRQYTVHFWDNTQYTSDIIHNTLLRQYTSDTIRNTLLRQYTIHFWDNTQYTSEEIHFWDKQKTKQPIWND